MLTTGPEDKEKKLFIILLVAIVLIAIILLILIGLFRKQIADERRLRCLVEGIVLAQGAAAILQKRPGPGEGEIKAMLEALSTTVNALLPMLQEASHAEASTRLMMELLQDIQSRTVYHESALVHTHECLSKLLGEVRQGTQQGAAAALGPSVGEMQAVLSRMEQHCRENRAPAFPLPPSSPMEGSLARMRMIVEGALAASQGDLSPVEGTRAGPGGIHWAEEDCGSLSSHGSSVSFWPSAPPQAASTGGGGPGPRPFSATELQEKRTTLRNALAHGPRSSTPQPLVADLRATRAGPLRPDHSMLAREMLLRRTVMAPDPSMFPYRSEWDSSIVAPETSMSDSSATQSGSREEESGPNRKN